MKYFIVTVICIFSFGAFADDLFSNPLTESAIKDIHQGIEDLSKETDRDYAKIYAEALNKRIDREAYLVARQQNQVTSMLESLQSEIKKKNEIIETYAALVSELEKRIKELENERTKNI